MLTTSKYTPFTTLSRAIGYFYNSKSGYSFRFNGQEQDNEVSGNGNIMTAEFWMYDGRLGRRWNRDPKPNPSISDYACFANSPIWFMDENGDSTVVDRKGNILYHDKKDKDKRVFAQFDSKKSDLTLIGKLGGKIDVNRIYKNLLDENVKEAKDIKNPFTFKNLVTDRGKWDYKMDKSTIFGLGYDGSTKFLFLGKIMDSEDIGNHHYGVVGAATGIFGLETLLKQAGANQVNKGRSRPEWQKYEEKIIENENGISYSIQVMIPPYGDDPRDQNQIKLGFNYFETHY